MNKFKLLAVFAVVLFLASCKEKPKCLKVDYEMYGKPVTTYQYMTRAECEATFSKYENVKISELKESDTDCLIKNIEK